jgi:hypothetical protein
VIIQLVPVFDFCEIFGLRMILCSLKTQRFSIKRNLFLSYRKQEKYAEHYF